MAARGAQHIPRPVATESFPKQSKTLKGNIVQDNQQSNFGKELCLLKKINTRVILLKVIQHILWTWSALCLLHSPGVWVMLSPSCLEFTAPLPLPSKDSFYKINKNMSLHILRGIKIQEQTQKDTVRLQISMNDVLRKQVTATWEMK